MHDITMRPRLSSAFAYCLTAQARQAPTEPNAGCQQKYGTSRPSVKQARNKLSAPSTSNGLPSTKIVAMFYFTLPVLLALQHQQFRAQIHHGKISLHFAMAPLPLAH